MNEKSQRNNYNQFQIYVEHFLKKYNIINDLLIIVKRTSRMRYFTVNKCFGEKNSVSL